MFTQLLHYVQVALDKGEAVLPFLAVIDTQNAALMKSTGLLRFVAINLNGFIVDFTPRKRVGYSYVKLSFTHLGGKFAQ